MSSAFSRLTKQLIGAALSICLGLSLLFSTFVGDVQAARTSMTGDYAKDTISVARSLQETIDTPLDSEGRQEAIDLITDYISRYRNRSQFNESISFTTMQTALNSLAGHYKTFGARPLPEELKTRLDKELGKAESIVLKES